MSTVRDMVKAIQVEIRQTPDLQPDRAAEMLTKLAALLGNIADEQRDADLAYATVHLALYEQHGAASRAKLYAEITPEYARKREAKDCGVLAVEMIRSLKMFLRTKEQERTWAGHQ